MLLFTQTANGQQSGQANQTFRDDLTFMQQHTDIITLADGKAAVAVAPAYQGRVMTSTVDRVNGASFGWINRKVIEAGLLAENARKGRLEEHIYVFGGEERFWLGPEGLSGIRNHHQQSWIVPRNRAGTLSWRRMLD
jgi:hypothetical protein